MSLLKKCWKSRSQSKSTEGNNLDLPKTHGVTYLAYQTPYHGQVMDIQKKLEIGFFDKQFCHANPIQKEHDIKLFLKPEDAIMFLKREYRLVDTPPNSRAVLLKLLCSVEEARELIDSSKSLNGVFVQAIDVRKFLPDVELEKDEVLEYDNPHYRPSPGLMSR